MARITRIFAVLAAICLAPSALAQGIRNSAHDLSNTSGTTTVKNQEAAHNQICIFCHTPHHALSTQLLWNHSASLTAAWSWGTDLDGNAMTRSTAGTTLPTTLRGASKRCLGCHDGTVALGDMSNAGGGAAGIMTGLGNIAGQTDAEGKLVNAAFLVGTSGNMGGNHPISIPYAGQTAYNSINSSVSAAEVGPAVLGGYFDVVTAGCTSATGICTSAPATDGRQGAAINLIPAIPGGTTNVGVECTSCHEPHNKYGYHSFARVDVENASGLCRSCHNK
jgi:doubled CXXCH motif protein